MLGFARSFLSPGSQLWWGITHDERSNVLGRWRAGNWAVSVLVDVSLVLSLLF